MATCTGMRRKSSDPGKVARCLTFLALSLALVMVVAFLAHSNELLLIPTAATLKDPAGKIFSFHRVEVCL